MIYDYDRDIITIKYNLLNLPDTIQFEQGHQIINKYAADGRKLKTSYATMYQALATPIYPGYVNRDIRVSQGNDYIGNIRYGAAYYYDSNGGYLGEERGIDMLFNPEGYTTNVSTSSVPQYHYYRKDHLGNNREVWRAPYKLGSTQYPAVNSNIAQYYPSGTPWSGATSHPYKYNSKEFVEMHGLDMYDSQFRWYYPAILQTTTIDPHCERYPSVSGYSWLAGNYVNRIDPDGRDVWENKEDLSDETKYSRHPSGKIIPKEDPWKWRPEDGYRMSDNVGKNSRGEEVWRDPAPGEDVTYYSIDEVTVTGRYLGGQGKFLGWMSLGSTLSGGAAWGLVNTLNSSTRFFQGLQAQSNALGLGLNYGSELGKVGTLGSIARWTGMGAGIFNIGVSGWQFSQAQTMDKKIEYGFDMFMGGLGFVPVVGPPIVLYWGTVGKPLHYQWGNNVLAPQIEMGIAGFPAVMPFK